MGISMELYYLALTALITTLMWLPYGLALVKEQGLAAAFGNRENVPQLSAWAERSKRANSNAVENLVVFAALILVAQAAGVHNEVTEWAALIYFWMRVLHYLAYTFGVIYARTLVWTIGWVCILVLAWQVLL